MFASVGRTEKSLLVWQLVHDAEGAGPSLKYLGTAFTEGQFVAWEPIAAEQMAGGYLVAWKNGAADEYVVWSTDSGGNYNGNATGYVAGSSLSLQALETTFHQDLNRDGTVDGADLGILLGEWR